jgi:hypothetical protein
MPKARLFFSHSTKKDSREREILVRLADALAADYEILLDRTALDAGGSWRSTINVWLAICDAAVILVHPDSIESEYCQYEWAVLSNRREIQKNFLIVPIYLGSAPNDIKTKAAHISEISGYFEFDDIDRVIAKVTEQLAAKLVLEQPSRKLISYIAASLQGALLREDSIEAEADNLNLDLGTWDFSTDKWFKFALKLMGAGLDIPVLTVLLNIRKHFGQAQEDRFRDIVQLIGFCSWVDMGSAQRLRACALRDKVAQGLFGLNAERLDTAKCYVLSGSERTWNTNWPIGAALGDFASEDHLHQRIRSELIGLLQLGDEEYSDAALKQELDFLRALQPVFVVLRPQGLSAGWLKRLRESELFAGVTFLVLTGETGISPELLAEDAFLKPFLPVGFEDYVWKNYARAIRHLKVT